MEELLKQLRNQVNNLTTNTLQGFADDRNEIQATLFQIENELRLRHTVKFEGTVLTSDYAGLSFSTVTEYRTFVRNLFITTNKRPAELRVQPKTLNMLKEHIK